MTVESEILDLSGLERTCLKPTNFPLERAGGFGFVNKDGNPVFCAGFDIDEVDLDLCYQFQASTNTWQPFGSNMNFPRGYPAVAPIGDDKVHKLI